MITGNCQKIMKGETTFLSTTNRDENEFSKVKVGLKTLGKFAFTVYTEPDNSYKFTVRFVQVEADKMPLVIDILRASPLQFKTEQ
jgi:hypothetical protein